MNTSKLHYLIVSLFLVSLLSACGGGGGSGNEPTSQPRSTNQLDVTQSDIDLVSTNVENRFNEVIATTSNKMLSNESLTGLWFRISGTANRRVSGNNSPDLRIENERTFRESFLRITESAEEILVDNIEGENHRHKVVQRDEKTYWEDIDNPNAYEKEVIIGDNNVITFIQDVIRVTTTNGELLSSFTTEKWIKVSDDNQAIIGTYISDLITSEINIDNFIRANLYLDVNFKGNYATQKIHGIGVKSGDVYYQSNQRIQTENGETTGVFGSETIVDGFTFFFTDTNSGGNSEVNLTSIQ